MRVWITGAEGLLGRALRQVLQNRGIDCLGSNHVQADVADLASMTAFYRKAGPFTHLINCAAYTAVDRAESDPEEARRVNTLAPVIIGTVAAQENIRVVHLSTDYVFDGKAKVPYLETNRIAPQTIYGMTKAEGEKHLLTTLPHACIVRTSWLFGAGGKNFVSAMMALMDRQEEVRVVADQKGRPTYALDLAEALVCMLDGSGVYHMANQGETTWYEWAEEIRAEALELGLPLMCKRLVPITTAEFAAPAPRPLYSVLDTTKADLLLGAPLRHWKEALKQFLKESYALTE